jgi:hypothetical protein
MGYTTDFTGEFKITPQLKTADKEFLTKLSTSRRMKRCVGPEYGIEGEFYVAGADDDNFGQEDKTGIIDYNTPPRTQPGLWCQWTPTEEGDALVWDGGEKFYNYVGWLQYLIIWLKERGYEVNGKVRWAGESSGDSGVILVKNNVIKAKDDKITNELDDE